MRLWAAVPLALLSFSCPAAKNGTPADRTLQLHVNQVTLERTGPKSAIVQYAGSARTGRYTVLKGGTAVHSGELVALPDFTEWGGGTKYFKADFSALNVSGTYRLEVGVGADTATSPSFTVEDNAIFVTTASALLDYFRANRYTNPADRRIRVFDSNRFVDVRGGWKDAGGDNGKYLSHLSYANFFNPQQAGLVVWALGAAYDRAPALFHKEGLSARVIEEAFWGADYLHRLLDEQGYFYMTVFDRWGETGAERMVTAYVGIDGVYTKDYQAAFREGGGVAIAALARAATLADTAGTRGEFSQAQYLQDAERAFAHLQQNNLRYCDDGVENIIDDYTALLAATELYRATHEEAYLRAARYRADNLNRRLTKDGWFVSDDGSRPYYHAVEAGFPIVSLVYYLDVEPDHQRAVQTTNTIRAALEHQLVLDHKVANPYNYARQDFKLYKNGKLGEKTLDGFFIPHSNESGYWWQGESARLASLATAAVLGGRVIGGNAAGPFAIDTPLAEFAQNQLDWTLGRNPFDVCLLYGFGIRNPPSAESAGEMVRGGVSNGITGATLSDEGRGITFAPGPDEENWRWLEQWLPHSTWLLLAATALTSGPTSAQPPASATAGP
jgi:hypothetical protein